MIQDGRITPPFYFNIQTKPVAPALASVAPPPFETA